MKNIGFIGAGNMGGAIIGGILKAGLFSKENIMASDLSGALLDKRKEEYGIHVTTDNLETAQFSDILVLAVKPFLLKGVIDQVKDHVRPGVLIVSIAAGWTLAQLEEAFGGQTHVIRVMPNTPCMVGEGMAAVFAGKYATEEEIEQVRTVFAVQDKAQVLEERLIDAVGAVSGSSPAYVYMFIEAMADAAVKGGMPRKMAYEFAAQSVLGAAKMVLETGLHPGELKDQVCSPSGSTIEAVQVLEERGFRGAVIDALVACMDKTIKMSKQ